MKPVSTKNAPAAIGTYSQAIIHGDSAYISGQIPLDPDTMLLVSDDIEDQIRQVFRNLAAIAEAMGCSLSSVVKFNVYVTDLAHFPLVNSIMEQLLTEPYPARAVVEVSALPKGAQIEIDAIVATNNSSPAS